MYVKLTPTSKPYTCSRPAVTFVYSNLRPFALSVALAPDQQVCLLQLLWGRTDVYNNCIRPSAIVVAAESDQQPFINSCTEPACMYVKLAPTSRSYTCSRPAVAFVIAISDHLHCLLHLHPIIKYVCYSCSGAELMFITIVSDRQPLL